MILEKEDVSLYYEVRGEGEPLILIHGLMVDAGMFEKTAGFLSRFYRVITYDRRGNSRSILQGAPAFSMETQARDILDLMEHLKIGCAYFAGASAGGTIGQYFLQQHPEKVLHLIMYEAAMLGYMSDQDEVRKWIDSMLDLIGRRKLNKALLQFADNIASFDERSPQKSQEQMMREMCNCQYAFTQEFPVLAAYRPDIGILKSLSHKVTLAAGEMSRGTVYYRGTLQLAEELGKAAVFWPGYHNLPFDLPLEFAVNVLGTLYLTEDPEGRQIPAGSL